jgi:phosphonate transport system ATP-binding protein
LSDADSTAAHFALRGACVRFGRIAALDGVDLAIAPGEAVAFVGPSGAGKTTLLRLLNASLRPTAGTVLVGGRDLAALSPRELRAVRASLGFVHQDLSLIPNLRVSVNVQAGRLGRLGLWRSLRAMMFPPRADLERIFALLERVGIADKLFARTDKLSGGQRQRVALARALYQEPTGLLADEPVAHVDPARAREMIALLVRISREENLTLAVSLHNLDLAREFFPRLIGLRAGRIQFDRRADAVGEAEFHALYDLTNGELRDGD